ncbi:hypothetical protein J2Z62_000681 [Mycoplasmoides fastidiosum]|uniref:Uncharacterized protein n=1 Tax=Mycoplasmoides fastidiosum TaxID=92758 RepID=A0ABU0M068_9BACT|nr:hypothetical protein [Mycoplasmoides fastidiosum]MDQ0514243.1 hypothetical protein [Mycoplasmoides fastidiosum]UUD37349.1 hypothetical protein NPA10_02070 [Mycoplasmoides fastidiosum]
MNNQNNKFDWLNNTGRDYDLNDLRVVLKKDHEPNPYEDIISIKKNWKIYAERFEEFAPLLPNAINLYRINSQKFLNKSELQPIFIKKQQTNSVVPRVEANLKHEIRLHQIDIEVQPQMAITSRKQSDSINFQHIDPNVSDWKKQPVNKKVLTEIYKPLTYYDVKDWIKFFIKGNK